MDKDILDIIKFTGTALIAVISWVIGHYFNSKRDQTNKRRDLTNQHLINAYRILTNEIVQRPQTKESDQKLELIIAEIQLFGSNEQIEMVKIVANDIVNKKKFNLDNLINSLRKELRVQLGLDPVDGNVTWLRFHE